jgi:hypothetical protein
MNKFEDYGMDEDRGMEIERMLREVSNFEDMAMVL